MLYKDGQLVPSSQRMDQTSTRQVYGFKDVGHYTVRIDNINGDNERIDFAIQVTPEFPFGLFAGMVSLFTAVAVVHRFRRQLVIE
jgi:hypothetical protein